MKKLLYFILLTIPILCLGCDTDNDDSLDQSISCSKLKDALIANEEDKVSIEIDHLLNAQGQINGLDRSFEKLIEQIDSCPDLQVNDSCFGCIQTSPPQSEIWITVTQNTQAIRRAIDLSHSKTRLTFLKMHD